MRVFVDVPQSAAQDMTSGLTAHITAGTVPGKTFDGKVTRTANAINDQTRTLRVEVDIPNPDHALVSGMYVNVAFDISNAGFLQVPAAALVFRSKGPQVALIGKGDKIDFRDVSIARDNGGSVEIASGIEAGDKIALNIGNQIAEGDTVAVQDHSDGKANGQK